jgi:hypothetical protein
MITQEHIAVEGIVPTLATRREATFDSKGRTLGKSQQGSTQKNSRKKGAHSRYFKIVTQSKVAKLENERPFEPQNRSSSKGVKLAWIVQVFD